LITRDLEIVLKAAFQEAKNRRHEFVCIEHLLLALLEDSNAHEAIVNCGGDVDALKAELDEFLSTRMEALPEGTKQEKPLYWSQKERVTKPICGVHWAKRKR